MNTAHPSLDPPVVTPERLERLEEWVAEYVASVRETWIENGEPVDTPEGRTALELVAESMRCTDIPKWMPLAEAILTYKVSITEAAPDELRSALRTYKSSTRDEIDAALCNQFGIELLSLYKLRDGFTVDLDADDPTGECALYRYFDESGRLLYVGIAGDPNLRADQHRDRSKWHRFSVHRDVDWYASRRDALAAEREAIASELPVFNRTHASARQKAAALDYVLDRFPETPPPH